MAAARHLRIVAALGATGLLAACAAPDADFATRCMSRVKPVGQYDYAAGQDIPVVMAGQGGTQAGADAVNACIDRLAAEQGLKPGMARTMPSGGPAAATVAEGGSQLRTLVGRPAAPIAVQAQPVPAAGNLPLPTQYPLMPGDRELWFSMTRAQQQRALTYLQSGSTIRSSLGAN